MSELQVLRQSEQSYLVHLEQNSSKSLQFQFGVEFEITIETNTQSIVYIDFASDETHQYYTRLICDFNKQQLILDREKSGIPLATEYGTTRVLSNNIVSILKLQVFLDRSSIEIFINDGESVSSSRIFPQENQTHLFLNQAYSDSTINLKSWNLSSIWPNNQNNH
nr:GH32 C-terminal domain-containing protein [Streptococcus sp. S784/96/1]